MSTTNNVISVKCKYHGYLNYLYDTIVPNVDKWLQQRNMRVVVVQSYDTLLRPPTDSVVTVYFSSAIGTGNTYEVCFRLKFVDPKLAMMFALGFSEYEPKLITL